MLLTNLRPAKRPEKAPGRKCQSMDCIIEPCSNEYDSVTGLLVPLKHKVRKVIFHNKIHNFTFTLYLI